jgi:hypothetical protein
MSKSSNATFLIDSVKSMDHRLRAMERGARQQSDKISALAVRLEGGQERIIKQQQLILELLQQRQHVDLGEELAAMDRQYPEADIPHPSHQKEGKPGKWYLNQIVDRDYTAALEEILDQLDVSVELKKIKSLANNVMQRLTSKNPDTIGTKWSLLPDSLTVWMVEELEAVAWDDDIAIFRCQNSWFAKNIMRAAWAQKLPRKVKRIEHTADHDNVPL